MLELGGFEVIFLHDLGKKVIDNSLGGADQGLVTQDKTRKVTERNRFTKGPRVHPWGFGRAG